MIKAQQEGILQALIQAGVITVDQATAAMQQLTDGASIEAVIIDGKLADEEVFTQARAKALGLPYINLQGQNITREVLSIIPESTAREHEIVAYGETDQELLVAMANPADRQIVEFMHKKVDKPVTVALASKESIKLGLNQYRLSLNTELDEIIRTAATATVSDKEDASLAAEELPIIRIIDLALKHAILQNASDIHIEPTEDNVILRYRVDGILHDVIDLPKAYQAGLIARIKVLSNLKIDEHRLPQDGRFKVEKDDYNVAFRVSVLPVFDGEKIVMRLLDESGRGVELDNMGMRPHTLAAFRRNIEKPNGMVLVTGPTGSGKTTTLYAAMRELNKPEVNISTIEDPIEYRMQRINQTQVAPKIGLTFSNGLRALVRQDPDILMVGEIRDEETASLAVNAALTGHLVLSTLHTNSAAGAMPRLLDMNVEAFLIASTANILVAQRLVRRLCPECKTSAALDDGVVAKLAEVIDVETLLASLKKEKIIAADKKLNDLQVFLPKGCKACTEGYKGRLGIYEFIEFTEDLRKLITPTVTAEDLQQAAKKQQGMITMIEDGFMKVVEGITSIEEVLRVAKE